jgi:predicted N-formylglutamate amidohydrolase
MSASSGSDQPDGAAPLAGSAGLRFLVTCEHAGHRVPARYADLFHGHSDLLLSHRGWDPGALSLARMLARALGAPLRFSLTTRLLVDTNRSPGHPGVFSEVSRSLSGPERERVMRRYHARHMGRVHEVLRGWEGSGDLVVHLGIHSFTPVWEGREREVDIAVLFDPDRALEARFAARWTATMALALPELRVRQNQPYHGADDGLTTSLRENLPADRYLGIELEVSQAVTGSESPHRRRVFEKVRDSLVETVAHLARSGFPE